MSKPDQEALDRAIAADLYQNDLNALKELSPARLQIVERAIAAKKQNADTSQRDMERKISRMSDFEIQELIRDGDDAKRRGNG
jgi:hypothetical protein